MKELKNNKEKELFKGEVIAPFQIGTNKPKKYKKGDKFSTEDENLFNHLVRTVKIKK